MERDADPNMASGYVVILTSLRVVSRLISIHLGRDLAAIVFDEFALLYQLAEHIEVIKPNKIKKLVLNLFVFFGREDYLQ